MGKKRHRGQWCWCCGCIRANERFSGKNHGRHLCRGCARLPLGEREFRSAELDLARIYWRSGKFRRKRPLIARYLRHHHPWVQLLAEAVLRPRKWESDWDDFQDWQDLAELGYLHHDPIATVDSMPEEWWASAMAERPHDLEDRD